MQEDYRKEHIARTNASAVPAPTTIIVLIRHALDFAKRADRYRRR